MTDLIHKPAQDLQLELQHAEAVAKASAALPAAYQDSPGAILLANEWARARDLDLLTVIQTVSFIDGRPIVDATMQRALAARAGYDIRVTEATTETATVEIWRGGQQVGAETFTMTEAKNAGLTGKKNWQKWPKNMLVARATANAMRWHAPEVLLGVFIEGELEADPVVPQDPRPTPSTPTPPPAASSDDSDVEDAEIVTDPLVTAKQVGKLRGALAAFDVNTDAQQTTWASNELGRQIDRLEELTESEGRTLWETAKAAATKVKP